MSSGDAGDQYYEDLGNEADAERDLAESLHNTYWINLLLYSDSLEMSEALEELVPELKKTTAAKTTHRSNLKKCLSTILSNLVSNYTADVERYTIYGRDDKDYPDKRYNPIEIKLSGAIAVIDGLDELGYLENHKGYSLSQYYYNRKSRVRATPAFIDMLERRTGFNAFHIQELEASEVVILRAKGETRYGRQISTGEDYKYTDTRETKRMRRQLEAYNEALEAVDITIDPSFTMPPEVLYNAGNKKYRRVFNWKSFKLGGRYSGPWWQGVSKEVRTQIVIDGEPTVECDYTAQHVHLMYHIAGYSYWDIFEAGDDPYSVEGFGTEYRKFFKQVFLKITSSKSRKGLNIGMGRWVNEQAHYKEMDNKAATTAFIYKHSRLLPFLYRKYSETLSLELQNTDSYVSEYVITELLKHGIIALDIHDSYIVQRKHESILRQVMIDGFKHNKLISIPNTTHNL